MGVWKGGFMVGPMGRMVCWEAVCRDRVTLFSCFKVGSRLADFITTKSPRAEWVLDSVVALPTF